MFNSKSLWSINPSSFALIFFSFVLCSSCGLVSSSSENNMLTTAIDYSTNKLLESIDEIPNGSYPKLTGADGKWTLSQPEEWISGFYPGCLWKAYNFRKDDRFFNAASLFTEGLENQQFNSATHDVGFMILNSYGEGYKITHDEKYKDVILQAAQSLSTRYNPIVGSIQSWNGEFQVIIDNMMNLEILFWAAKNGGDQKFYDIAVSHAYKTLQNHIREDGSTFHVVHYNPLTGEVTRKRTAQGYSDNSTWARGQAWAIYGFTMCYRETGNLDFLNAAIKTANYYINNLPDDFIPNWDFNLPENYEKNFRDASAAAIAVSALLELRNYTPNSAYDNIIVSTLNILIRSYLSFHSACSGIMLHCAYNVNSDDPEYWDAATIWGDYYFLESLERFEKSDLLHLLN